jgi:beta-lactamase class A
VDIRRRRLATINGGGWRKRRRDHKAAQAQCDFGPQASPHTRDQVGPFAARAEGEGQMTITTRWLYSVDGQAKYYQDGDYIYSKNGQCEFSVSNGRWYAIKGGAAEYYVSDNWVHSRDGKAMFHFG